MAKQMKKLNTKSLTLLALMTALVVLVQIISANVKFGPFSITLAHIPIVIGAALLGPIAGAWLGMTMGITVLLSGDAAAFLTVNFAATVFVVLLKGLLAGLAAGLIYKLLSKKNDTVAIFSAAFTCPIVNTAVFFIGSLLFFLPTIATWAGEGTSAISFIIVGLIGWNFVVEMATALVLTPVIKKIITVGKKMRHNKNYI